MLLLILLLLEEYKHQKKTELSEAPSILDASSISVFNSSKKLFIIQIENGRLKAVYISIIPVYVPARPVILKIKKIGTMTIIGGSILVVKIINK